MLCLPLSGVPQGTVLGPLLFLTFINDLTEVTNSEARLFADDCLLYRSIFSRKDTENLQQDLAALEDWEKKAVDRERFPVVLLITLLLLMKYGH
jgi:hypothetical protein